MGLRAVGRRAAACWCAPLAAAAEQQSLERARANFLSGGGRDALCPLRSHTMFEDGSDSCCYKKSSCVSLRVFRLSETLRRSSC